MTDRMKEARELFHKMSNAAMGDDERFRLLKEAFVAAYEAGRLEERERLHRMHRRAQKAEGRLKRMQDAHATACYYAFKEHIDYRHYGGRLLSNSTLFPVVNTRRKWDVVPDWMKTPHWREANTAAIRKREEAPA